MNPRITIDNLGFNASQRYASDQKMLEETESLAKDSQVVFSKIQVDVSNPSFHSECDTLLATSKKSTAWALFAPPFGYNERTKHSFTFELLPALSLEEKKAFYLQKINDYEQEQKHPDNQELEEQESFAAETKKKKDTLTHLLHCILHLNEYMLYANIKRSQYHKG